MEYGVENIVILEAENRIGGRINTVQLGDGVVELGAQWVHGEEGNVVFAMASQNGLLMDSTISDEYGNASFIDSSGRIIDTDISKQFYNILEEIGETGSDDLQNFTGSLGEYYTDEYFKRLQERSIAKSDLAESFLDWYHKALNSYNAAESWFDASGRGDTEYEECEGKQNWAWKSGYSTVLKLLMKKIPDPSKELPLINKTKLNTEVIKIKWKKLSEENEDKVIVESSDGSSYTADHVIVTVSLGVLKERAADMFEPALPPQKLNSVTGLSIGTVDKIFLKFAYKWWPDDINEFRFLWINENATCEGEIQQKNCWFQDMFEFHAVDNQPLVLCGWVSGSSARYMEKLSDEEVMHDTVQLLNMFVGKALNVTVPQPELILRSNWSSNPHFRGSYSLRTMMTEEMGASAAELAEPVVNDGGETVLLFAGEATHSTHYSTVHGAIESGWREAKRIRRLYEHRKPL
ncbi:spermine oxidase-like isoform X2 [Periplaneta americana]